MSGPSQEQLAAKNYQGEGMGVEGSTSKPVILIIEDDENCRQVFSEFLSDEFTVFTAEDGKSGIEKVQQISPKAVLLDVNMPGFTGHDACAELRKNRTTSAVPVIMISGMNDEAERTKAFENGADDFIPKPFGKAEVVARVRSKIQRFFSEPSSKPELTQTSDAKEMRAGNLCLYPDRYELTIDDRIVDKISALEIRLLKFFLENQNRVISRDELLNVLWKDAVVLSRTVDTHIASLRRKLRGFSGRIRTVYGAGYILKP